ncbi:MAG: PD40 domain-containing protein [Bacteroidetes bacterium]|nr:PD40 domain-containing protein [Bacteroidota bacterium]
MKPSQLILSSIIFSFILFSCKDSNTKQQTNGLITYYSNQKGNSNIFVMKPDGTRQCELTNYKSKNICGVWSPDGNKMIFSSERDGNSEIYIMDAYGNNQKRLTNNNTPDYHQRWSPNGKQIVYVSNEDGNQEIYIMNADGSNKTNLTNSEINEMFPCWSPDGETILYCSEENEGWKIYRMNVNGENRVKVTDYSGSNWELYPQFSPNGKKIAYFTHEPINKISNIFVMNKNGKHSIQLTNSDFVDEDPSWSPDGKFIVFQSNRTGNYQIFTMKTDGTEQTCLSNNKNNEYWPSWSWIQEF